MKEETCPFKDYDYISLGGGVSEGGGGMHEEGGCEKKKNLSVLRLWL